MRCQSVHFVVMAGALCIVTWAALTFSEESVVLQAKSAALEGRSPARRLLSEGLSGSKSSRARVDAPGESGPDLSPLFPQPETLFCSEGTDSVYGANGDQAWNEAVQLTASGPCSLFTLLYYPGDPFAESPDLTWGVWDDDGAGGLPSTLLDSGTVTPTYYDWFQVNLAAPIFIPGGDNIYIGWLDINGEPYYWNGMDDSLDGCNYWFDGTVWVPDVFFSGDFMIQGICQRVTGVAEKASRRPHAPKMYFLFQNNPNPFSQQTQIPYQIKERGEVSLEVYDLTGRLVRTLVKEEVEPGGRLVQWDGSDETGSPVPSGVYLYCLKAGGFISTRMLVLVRSVSF